MSGGRESEAVFSLLRNECEPRRGPVNSMAAVGEIRRLGLWRLCFFASERNICFISDGVYFIGTEQEDVNLRCENTFCKETLSMA